jgi:hypothetical protein
MLINFDKHPELNEIAYARFEERTRIMSIMKSILLKFPEQFQSRKRHRIATDISNLLYKEIEDKFGLL